MHFVFQLLFLVVPVASLRPISAKESFTRSLQQLTPILPTLFLPLIANAATKGKLEYQPALQGLDYGKPRTYYPDFVQKDSGLQYKVVKEGTG